jgi:hypothetical protein
MSELREPRFHNLDLARPLSLVDKQGIRGRWSGNERRKLVQPGEEIYR